MLNLKPVETEGGFDWNIDVNFSRTEAVLECRKIQIARNKKLCVSRSLRHGWAAVGERMGDMYGIDIRGLATIRRVLIMMRQDSCRRSCL